MAHARPVSAGPAGMADAVPSGYSAPSGADQNASKGPEALTLLPETSASSHGRAKIQELIPGSGVASLQSNADASNGEAADVHEGAAAGRSPPVLQPARSSGFGFSFDRKKKAPGGRSAHSQQPSQAENITNGPRFHCCQPCTPELHPHPVCVPLVKALAMSIRLLCSIANRPAVEPSTAVINHQVQAGRCCLQGTPTEHGRQLAVHAPLTGVPCSQHLPACVCWHITAANVCIAGKGPSSYFIFPHGQIVFGNGDILQGMGTNLSGRSLDA